VVLAGGMVSVLVIGSATPTLVNLYKLNQAEAYTRAYYKENPPNEMRSMWAPYPNGTLLTMSGHRRSTEENLNRALADTVVLKELNSKDPRWKIKHAHLRLLEGNEEEAIELLTTAKAQGLNTAATDIDLAVAYYQKSLKERANTSGASQPS